MRDSSARESASQARARRRRRAAYAAARAAAGLDPAPATGRPRVERIEGPVIGRTRAEIGWLAAQLDPGRNTVRARDLPATSGELVWWRCAAGIDHLWQASVRDRTMRAAGCPFCAERRVGRSGSLSATHPDIAAQWHPTRNGATTPADVTHGSHYEAWWQCPACKGHVWRACVSSRTSMHSGCSLCAAMKRPGGKKRADAENNAVA